MKEFVISEVKAETAILVGLITPKQDEAKTKEYLDELEFLADTAGAVTVKRYTQRVGGPSSITYVGKGKLEEIRAYIKAEEEEDREIGMVIFDDELTAKQMRNIEQALQDIKPSNGKSVRDLDKIIAVAELPIGEDEKDAAFKVLLNEKTYEKYKQGIGAGLLSVQYADFLKALDRINDNSSVSQDEFISAVEASGISHEAARKLWYARGWKTTSPWG